MKNATASEDIDTIMLAPEIASLPSGFGGCALCRNSGNCSLAVNSSSSGVFCGDLAESKAPCCCPYQTECRVTRYSTSCECTPTVVGSNARSIRLAADAAQAEEDTQMSASTEILLHLTAYMSLFVIATFIDDWVEWCRDCRRSQLVPSAVDKGILKLKEKYARRRKQRMPTHNATLFSDSEDEDDFGQVDESPSVMARAPLLLAMSPMARTGELEVSDDNAEVVETAVQDDAMDRVA